jgi:hypothetical protein
MGTWKDVVPDQLLNFCKRLLIISVASPTLGTPGKVEQQKLDVVP